MPILMTDVFPRDRYISFYGFLSMTLTTFVMVGTIFEIDHLYCKAFRYLYHIIYRFEELRIERSTC